jgi:diguanylate cyclase
VSTAWAVSALGTTGTVFAVQLIVASGIFVVLLYALSRQLERQTATRIAAEYAAEYAVRDSLTGVFTRFALGLRFDQALGIARRADRRLAIFFVDVDDFKRVNDDFGHAAGDDVLRELARRIQAAVRGADTVARLGGDEFVVLSFVDDAARAASIADRLVAVSEEPLRIAGMEIAVGVSVGVAVTPDDGTEIEALLASADGAMYAAKVRGKGRRALASEATPIPTSRPEAAPAVSGDATR